MGTWIGRIPAVTSNLDLDKAEIGSLLLFAGLGSLIAFQFIGRLIECYGSPRSAQCAGYLTVGGLAFLALAPTPATLGGAMLFFGFVIGATGVAMNAQGISVERTLGRPVMSSLHGFFSLGTLIGSAFGGLMAQIGIGAIPHFLGASGPGLATLVWASAHFIADEPT